MATRSNALTEENQLARIEEDGRIMVLAQGVEAVARRMVG